MPQSNPEARSPSRLIAGGREYRIEPSSGGLAPEWDVFLQTIPQGHYQQSSLWGEFKTSEGWHVHRLMARTAAGLAGGFQLLWKRKGPLGVGYINKGPLAAGDDPALGQALLERVEPTARELGLSAVILQLPDDCRWPQAWLAPLGYVRSNPLAVIEATYLIETGPGIDALRQGYDRTIRQGLRKARDAGLTVRAGTEADLATFFELMATTCRRQHSAPNPASVTGLGLLWRLFAPHGLADLAFAMHEGQAIAGRMNLHFGDRATQWKKGWTEALPELRPNELLTDHALEWAAGHGYRLCDFSAIDRLNAQRLLAGQSRTGPIARSRDMYNLRFGGRPVLQPRAHLLVLNPAARWLYEQTVGLWEDAGEQRLLAAAGLRPGSTAAAPM